MLASFLFKVKDHRRKQGRQYQLGHILLFSILAIVSGADSYRKVHAFIEAHYTELDAIFDLGWKRILAHTTIRYIIRGVSSIDSAEKTLDSVGQSGTKKIHRTWEAFQSSKKRGKKRIARHLLLISCHSLLSLFHFRGPFSLSLFNLVTMYPPRIAHRG